MSAGNATFQSSLYCGLSPKYGNVMFLKNGAAALGLLWADLHMSDALLLHAALRGTLSSSMLGPASCRRESALGVPNECRTAVGGGHARTDLAAARAWDAAIAHEVVSAPAAQGGCDRGRRL